MTTTDSLLDFILNLFRDEKARAEFQEDPEGTLQAHGFGDLCVADLNEALPLVMDARGQSAGADVHPPAPAPGESDHEAAIRHIEYITNTYTDDRDTQVDNSVNQNIWADGDVSQTFDNDPVTASGDGSVAAGGDVRNVATGDGSAAGDGSVSGDGNLVGDDNVTGDRNAFGEDNVTGDGNATGAGSFVGDGNTVVEDSTVSFGSGAASSAEFDDSRVDDGGAVSVGGDAGGYREGTDVAASGSGDTAVAVGDSNRQTDTEDSHDTVDSYDTEDSYNPEDSYDAEDSYNDSHDDNRSSQDSHDDNRSFKGGDLVGF